jgi:hypothetical protein
MQPVSKVFHDNGNIVARWECCGSKVLAVVFTPMKVLGVDAPGFAEEFLRKNGIDVLTFQRRGETWYQDLSRRTFDKVLTPLRKRYDRIVFYGSSLGAYAALYYAQDEHVLAFSPRVPIHPDYRHFGKSADLNNAPFVHDPLGFTPNAVVVYDPLNEWDRAFVEKEVRAPAGSFYRVPFAGHSAITYLGEAKVLPRIVLDYIKRGERPKMDDLLTARRKSPKAHTHFADICEARKHTGWAAMAVAEGLDKWPADRELLARSKRFGLIFDDPPHIALQA